MIPGRVLTICLFAAALTLIGVVELIAHRADSRVPTLGEMCGFIMKYQLDRLPIGRIAVCGFWWWLGWHFFAR